MKANGKMTFMMDKVKRLGQMGHALRVSSNKEKRMVMGHMFGQMAPVIVAIGLTIR